MSIPASRLRMGVAWLLFSTLVFSAAFLVFWRLRHPSRVNGTATTKNLTTYVGEEMQPNVSPDGERFAFVWDADRGKYDIYVRAVDRDEPQRLTSESGHNLYPRWSPDGRDIAYLNVDEKRLALYLRPSTGGAPRLVSRAAIQPSPWHLDPRDISSYWSADWTPDGSGMITNIVDGPARPQGALYRVPVGGGSAQRLTSPPIGTSDYQPAAAPNGRWLVFFRATSKLTGDLWLLDLVSGRLRALTHQMSDIKGLAWLKDSSAIIYSSGHTGLYRLRLHRLEDDHDTEIMTVGVNAIDPCIDENKHLLIYTDFSARANIWTAQLGKGIETPRRLSPSSLTSTSATYSPEGRAIAFVSNRSGHWEIWLTDASGTNARQLTNFNGPLVDAPHWSPDGRSIVFEARPNGRSQIFALDLNGNQPTELTKATENAKMPVFSRDGHWIYYNSDAAGDPRIWRMSPTGKDRTLLSKISGYDVVQTDDPATLFFLSGDQYLYTMPSDGGLATRVTGAGKIGLSRYLASSGRSIFFANDTAVPVTLMRYTPDTGKLSKVGVLASQIVGSTPSLSVSSDGTRMLYSVQESGTSDIRAMSF